LEIEERMKEFENLKSGKVPDESTMRNKLAKLVTVMSPGDVMEFRAENHKAVYITKWKENDARLEPSIRISWLIHMLYNDETQKSLDTHEDLGYMDLYTAKVIFEFVTRSDLVMTHKKLY